MEQCSKGSIKEHHGTNYRFDLHYCEPIEKSTLYYDIYVEIG